MKVIKYEENPFIGITEIKTRGKKIAITGIDNYSIINHATGTVEGIAFQTYKEVDNEEFVKIYTANASLLFDLKNPGKKIFQMLLIAVQSNAINKDQIYLNYDECKKLAVKMKVQIGKSTFFEGIKELINLQIIAKSKNINVFFINPNVLFNGDRVAFIQGIKRRKQVENIKNKALTEGIQKNKSIESNQHHKDSELIQNVTFLMVKTYNIPEQKARELIIKYPIEIIEAVIDKIEKLKQMNSAVVEPISKIPSYMVHCIENNLTKINQTM